MTNECHENVDKKINQFSHTHLFIARRCNLPFNNSKGQILIKLFNIHNSSSRSSMAYF